MYNMITVKNQAKKWGNSFGVVIPAEVARRIKLKEGQTVEITIKLEKRVDGFGRFSKASSFKEDKSIHKEFL